MKKPYAELTREELLGLQKHLKTEYRRMQAMDLKLDMSRGKPCTEHGNAGRPEQRDGAPQ